MDYRPPLSAQRPAPPQRAVSGGSYGGHTLPKRPPLPSRLSNVRSISQPVNVVDLTADGVRAGGRSGRVLASASKDEMVTSPEVIDLEDDNIEPPAKRVKTAGEEFQATGEDGHSNVVDMAHEIQPGTALPNLPRARPSAGRVGAHRRNRLGIEPSARKAHGLDPPAVATRVPPPKKVLDFSPWTGNHQEDVLNENVIKGGYFDKIAGTNQSETNTAKSSIWPSLSQKNHAGLSALSYMYVAVMEKRQALGKCIAPSTFKPPPRLAVQEAKRAKWLEDLADPAVALRRLSKTIPHGIKGKLLMEQCLSKFIPLHRAMWLVRGVGMHELRAFRRKGFNEAQAASGEVKWVHEWTANVTQFLEDIMAACGQPDWQRKLNYAVKLATALFSEKLLDADYYLDWIVSSLADSTIERLPIWVILTKIHWTDLMMFGRRGRRLAKGVLGHLRSLASTGLPVNSLLKTNLQKMVGAMAVANRGCLILPRTWHEFHGLLAPTPSSPAESPASNVVRRNERLAGPLNKTPENLKSVYLDLYDALDTAGTDLDVDVLAKKCAGFMSDPAKLVPALLDWASTRFRAGDSRIYLAARIIAQVQDDEHDTDSIILHFLSAAKSLDAHAEENVHRVIVELVRLQAFSVGKYLQWIIASGALYAEERTSVTSLIAALPMNGLPVRVINTRNMLMSRLGYETDETQAAQSILDEVDRLFVNGCGVSARDISLPDQLSRSAAYSLAQQLTAKADLTVKESGLSVAQFCSLRDLIERVGDISSLTNLVAIASSSDVGALLATAADTVNYHASSFAVLEQLAPSLDRLSEQYLALRPHQPLDRAFILALTGLAKRVPGKASLIKLLGDDLILCGQQTSLAACSPASDSVIDMHATKLDSDEDIDAVFASGNVMDEQLMQRVFSRVIQRASRSRSSGATTLTRVCGWLDQLRAVDASRVLESTVDKYLRSATGSGHAVPIAVVASLALSGCAPLHTLLDLAKDDQDPQTAERWLAVFFPRRNELDLEATERYRFRLHQERCQAERANDLMMILRTAMGSGDFDGHNDDAIVSFVVQTTSTYQQTIHDLFAGSATADIRRRNASCFLNAILGQSAGHDVDIAVTIAMASPLSVRFSVASQYLRTAARSDLADLRNAILQAFEDHSEVWPQLLFVADEGTIQALREKAQEVLLQFTTDASTEGLEGRQEEVDRTLDLLAVTSNADQSTDSAFVATVVERLKDVEKQLTHGSDLGKACSAAKEALLRKLDLLLRLATLNVYAVEGESEAFLQTRVNLLQALCSLLLHQALQLHRHVIEYIFDLASTLSDSLSESTLATLKSRLPPEARLNFVLGVSFNATEAWLALATQVQPAGATQQQRALNKHHSQQSQQQLQPQKSTPRSASGAQGSGGAASAAQQRGWPAGAGIRGPAEVKMTPFQLRTWEMISDPASAVGENDTALSLGLFGMRKV